MKKKLIMGVAILSMAISFVGCSAANASNNSDTRTAINSGSLAKINIDELTEEFILTNADWREGYSFILVEDDSNERLMYLDEQLVPFYYDDSGNIVTSPIYPLDHAKIYDAINNPIAIQESNEYAPSDWSNEVTGYDVVYGETTENTTEFFDENNNPIAIQESNEYAPSSWSNEATGYSVVYVETTENTTELDD